MERAGDAAPLDLRKQLRELDAAVARREWEIIGSIDGKEQSLGRWQTKARCEQHVKEHFPSEGEHEVAGKLHHYRYRYEHRKELAPPAP